MPPMRDALWYKDPTTKELFKTGDPDGTWWSPAMALSPLRGANKVHSWFWAPNQDHAAHPTDTLVEMYLESVGRNCNLIIGEVVKPNGLVPESDIKRLAEFGREVQRRWGRPLAETAGRGSTVELKLPAAARVGSVEIMEEIAHGERIQRYTLSGLRPGGVWQELGRGQCVGHKRIEQVAAVEVSALRLQVHGTKAEPRIRRLAAYA
jgi:alpha-L-fucosidase